MGQTREVEVVRLVTRNTIEEAIHALGETKLTLDDRVAGVGMDDTEEKKADVQAEKKGEQMVEEMLVGKFKADVKDEKEIKSV